MPYIVDMCENTLESCMDFLPEGVVRLPPDFGLGVVSYTVDVRPQLNLFDALNKALQERDARVIEILLPYLYYIIKGWSMLPPWVGIVFRGLPPEARETVERLYTVRKNVHWSGFTSTSMSLEKAQGFASPGGVVFRINVATGR
jgi:hypothetical protein